MVVVVVEDFDSFQTPPPPAPPADGARSVESRVEPAADVAAASGPDENGGFSEAEFDKLIALVGRIREPARSRCRRAYLENPEGFAYIVGEALAGDKPAGLLVWLVRQGEHRHGPPFTPADIENVGALIREHRVCASCGIGGGRHVDGCEAAAA
jgi:hypothetical protein